MVVIRLARRGAKKKPFYHITAADKRAPRDGKYIEKLGYYNPVARGKALRLDVNLDRVDYWISVGAQVTDTTQRLLKEARKGSGNRLSEFNVAENVERDSAFAALRKAASDTEVEEFDTAMDVDDIKPISADDSPDSDATPEEDDSTTSAS